MLELVFSIIDYLKVIYVREINKNKNKNFEKIVSSHVIVKNISKKQIDNFYEIGMYY